MGILGEALSAMETLKSFLEGFFLVLGQQEEISVVEVHYWWISDSNDSKVVLHINIEVPMLPYSIAAPMEAGIALVQTNELPTVLTATLSFFVFMFKS